MKGLVGHNEDFDFYSEIKLLKDIELMSNLICLILLSFKIHMT